MRILISGAGIAGPCLAYWLDSYGFTPTLVEHAPGPRRGGYIIDFWGAGFDIAERMGLMPRILEKGYKVRALHEVDRHGKRVSGFDISAVERLTHGRQISVPRSELAAALLDAVDERVETIFGDSIAAIDDVGDEVRVRFEKGAPRTFDLVVGADGLHSHTRRLTFGDEDRFERYLGMKVAAFVVEGYRPRDELQYIMHRDVGKQVARFSMRDDRTMFLFVFADPRPEIPGDVAAQRRILYETFGSAGWECPEILRALERTDDVYFDRVSQIHMDRWSKDRVALVGDAAFCVSLLAGQGSALAMIAAYVLASDLESAHGDHRLAFARYETDLRALIADKQTAAVKFATFFAPRSRFGIFVGNQVMKLMSIPWVTDLAVGRQIADAIELPHF